MGGKGEIKLGILTPVPKNPIKKGEQETQGFTRKNQPFWGKKGGALPLGGKKLKKNFPKGNLKFFFKGAPLIPLFPNFPDKKKGEFLEFPKPIRFMF